MLQMVTKGLAFFFLPTFSLFVFQLIKDQIWKESEGTIALPQASQFLRV